jgi:hypothetical protein
MGAKLTEYFEKAKQKGGIGAQVKFAMIVKMSQNQAKDAPDSPEAIKAFEEAFGKL